MARLLRHQPLCRVMSMVGFLRFAITKCNIKQAFYVIQIFFSGKVEL